MLLELCRISTPQDRLLATVGKLGRKQLGTDDFFGRKRADAPPDKTETSGRSCFVLFVVRSGPCCVLMRLIVQLDRCDHGSVLSADYKVVAESVDAVIPLVEVKPFFHTEYSRHLNLRQDNMLRQGTDETVVKNLFWLAEKLAHIKEPSWCAGSEEEALKQ